MVSSAGAAVLRQHIRHRRGHVERGLHFCWVVREASVFPGEKPDAPTQGEQYWHKTKTESVSVRISGKKLLCDWWLPAKRNYFSPVWNITDQFYIFPVPVGALHFVTNECWASTTTSHPIVIKSLSHLFSRHQHLPYHWFFDKRAVDRHCYIPSKRFHRHSISFPGTGTCVGNCFFINNRWSSTIISHPIDSIVFYLELVLRNQFPPPTSIGSAQRYLIQFISSPFSSLLKTADSSRVGGGVEIETTKKRKDQAMMGRDPWTTERIAMAFGTFSRFHWSWTALLLPRPSWCVCSLPSVLYNTL